MKLILSRVFFIKENFGFIVGLALEENEFQPHLHITDFNGKEIGIPFSEWDDFFARMVSFASYFYISGFFPKQQLREGNSSSTNPIRFAFGEEEKKLIVSRKYYQLELGSRFEFDDDRRFAIDFDCLAFENFLLLKDSIEDYIREISTKIGFANDQFQKIVDKASEVIPSVTVNVEKMSRKWKLEKERDKIPALSAISVQMNEIRMKIEEFAGEDPISMEIIRTLITEIREKVIHRVK